MQSDATEKFLAPEKFPARIYRGNVLADCFEDAKRYFLQAYLDVVDLDSIRCAQDEGSFEDLFFYLQRTSG